MAKRSKSGVWERFSRTGVILILVYVMCLILGFAVRLVLFSDQKHSSIIPDKVVASAAGTSKADGSDGGHEATNPNILELKTDQKFLAVLEGGTASITVNMATTGQASAGDLVWSSSNTDVAAVDNEGVVTGVAKGSCEITAAVKGNEDISVSVPVTVRQLEQRDGCTYVDGILIVNKTYSLPSDFDPGKLDDTAEKAFEQLQADAAKEGLDIYIGSDFRRYSYQADTFSARPGFSEHQTGLTIDCNTIDDAFGQTKEAQWLAEHCADYGFIIRFPDGKEDITGYQYEPWHIRYVGVDTAKEIDQLGVSLEEYLGVQSEYTGPWEH